jgi:predicted phage replisome organizer
MADDKKYYYLKLKDNFFDSDALIILENMQDGYLYSNILLKLYLRSLKDLGRLMFNSRIPYNAEILSQITRHKVGVMEKALTVFVDLELIDVLDNGAIYMTDIQNFIGKSSTEADRKRLDYNRIKDEKVLIGETSEKPTLEKELDLELETETDIELKKEKPKSEKVIFFDRVIEYCNNDVLLEQTLREYISYRKLNHKKSKRMSLYALNLLLTKMDKLFINSEQKVTALNESIERGWNSVFAPNSKNSNERITSKDVTDW